MLTRDVHDVMSEFDYSCSSLAEAILELREEKDKLESEISRLTDELDDAKANS